MDRLRSVVACCFRSSSSQNLPSSCPNVQRLRVLGLQRQCILNVCVYRLWTEELVATSTKRVHLFSRQQGMGIGLKRIILYCVHGQVDTGPTPSTQFVAKADLLSYFLPASSLACMLACLLACLPLYVVCTQALLAWGPASHELSDNEDDQLYFLRSHRRSHLEISTDIDCTVIQCTRGFIQMIFRIATSPIKSKPKVEILLNEGVYWKS